MRGVYAAVANSMRPFIVKQLNYDLTPVAGLALVGQHLNRLAPVFKQVDRALPVRNGVANSDILRSYVGLLAQGKSDFDAIENFRGEDFFKQALEFTIRQANMVECLEFFTEIFLQRDSVADVGTIGVFETAQLFDEQLLDALLFKN